MKKDKQELLYRFLYYALVEIREEAYNAKNKKIYKIADLIHGLPLKMLMKSDEISDDSLVSFDTLWGEFCNRASNADLEKWVLSIADHIEKN